MAEADPAARLNATANVIARRSMGNREAGDNTLEEREAAIRPGQFRGAAGINILSFPAALVKPFLPTSSCMLLTRQYLYRRYANFQEVRIQRQG